MKAPLVLITRPLGQSTAFAQRCEALGYQVELLPCLGIEPLTVSEQQLRIKLGSCQYILFTSANAVRIADQILPLPWSGCQIHAIGDATARALAQRGQGVSMTPRSPYNSEAYIKQLKTVPASSLLVIKGYGGRDLIQAVLEERDWRVDTLDVYERVRPKVATDTIRASFSPAPDIISITSNEILQNLWTMCQSQVHTLTRLPLVVNSQRCAELARTLGFERDALVADPAGDTGQLACLAQWKASVYSKL